MKKIFSLLLVLSLCFSLLVPAVSGAPIEFKPEKQNYLVQFSDQIETAVLSSVGIQQDAILHQYELLPVALVEMTEKEVKELAQHPDIVAIEEDAEVEAFQTVPWGVTRVQAPTAHSAGYSGAGIRVAILDTGIDARHEDLNVYGGYSVFTDSANNNPYVDVNGHGTHVAGTVAALNNNIGVLGVAPGAQLYAVKVLNNSGGGSYSGIAQGIEWSINNRMNIINMSLGGSAHSSILQQYCDLAYNRGILVVAAAGNSGNAAGTGDNVAYPARYSSVIAVAATDSNNNRASFSSTGPAVELSAPGVGILSTLPGNRYGTANGTSMASPHVAGVAALVWQAKPNLTNVDLRRLLNITALPLGNGNHYGSGLVRAWNAITY
jgi:subtilisin